MKFSHILFIRVILLIFLLLGTDAIAQRRRNNFGFQFNRRHRLLAPNALQLTAGIDFMEGALGSHFKPGPTVQLSYSRFLNRKFSIGLEGRYSRYKAKELTSQRNVFEDYRAAELSAIFGYKYPFTKKLYGQAQLSTGYARISYSASGFTEELERLMNSSSFPEEAKDIFRQLLDQELSGGMASLSPQIGIGYALNKRFDFVINARLHFLIGKIEGKNMEPDETQQAILKEFDPTGSLNRFFKSSSLNQENALSFSLNIGLNFRF
ncbi:MAG: porin family protein [Cytophagales bacterium]|nr:porin family protein [Cytophagales bacterium]